MVTRILYLVPDSVFLKEFELTIIGLQSDNFFVYLGIVFLIALFLPRTSTMYVGKDFSPD